MPLLTTEKVSGTVEDAFEAEGVLSANEEGKEY
jgi:hypothetical protein